MSDHCTKKLYTAGPLKSVIDIQLCISGAMVLASLTSASVAWPKNIKGTIGLFSAVGLGYGIEETCLYLYMVYLWGSECEPFIQALHFSFGLGASIAPLIAREFILPRNESNLDQWSSDDVKIHYCYEIIAVGAMMVALIFFCLYKFCPISEEHPSRIDESSRTEPELFKRAINPTISMIEREWMRKKVLLVKVLCVISTCIFIFFYCGIEVNFGTYISPYAIDGPIHMTKSDGAIIASTFWFVFTFSRIITIFYIKIIGSRNNLILCCLILLISNAVLVPFPDNNTCLWIGTVLVGLGTSSVFASVFGFIELSIKITPLITSFNMAASCLGMSLYPILTAQFFDTDPKIFLYLLLGGSIAMILFLCLIIVTFKYYGILILEKEVSMVTVKPSFGRLNSMMSIASDTGKSKKSKRKIIKTIDE